MQQINTNVFLWSFAFLQIPTFVTSHATTPPTSLVNEITTEDGLQGALHSLAPTVIMGYMDPCPHCMILKPHFTALAKKYQTINFVLVNGPKLVMHKQVAQLTNNAIRIPGYPSIVFVQNGVIIDHVIGGNKQKLDQKVEALALLSKAKSTSKKALLRS